jgi:hypothetical protein
MRYSLRFEFTPAVSDNLKLGILHLIKDDLIVNSIRVASSYKGLQYWESWKKKGGLIPPGKWDVATTPFESDVRGVVTNISNVPSYFYSIFPEIQTQSNGVMRGEFGVHFDGNAPGSLGCIAAQTVIGWTRIIQFFSEANKNGILIIPLLVEYDK